MSTDINPLRLPEDLLASAVRLDYGSEDGALHVRRNEALNTATISYR